MGEDSGTDFYWGLGAPVFENASKDNPDIGDGAYLFDPQGNIRAWMIYPCKVACSNPAKGSIAMSAQPKKDEYISLTNTGGAPIDLEPYVLKSLPYSYAFAQGTVLGPGQTIRVHTQGDPSEDTATDRYWGMDRQILDNSGDVAALVDLQRHRDRLHRVRLEVLLTLEPSEGRCPRPGRLIGRDWPSATAAGPRARPGRLDGRDAREVRSLGCSLDCGSSRPSCRDYDRWLERADGGSARSMLPRLPRWTARRSRRCSRGGERRVAALDGLAVPRRHHDRAEPGAFAAAAAACAARRTARWLGVNPPHVSS